MLDLEPNFTWQQYEKFHAHWENLIRYHLVHLCHKDYLYIHTVGSCMATPVCIRSQACMAGNLKQEAQIRRSTRLQCLLISIVGRLIFLRRGQNQYQISPQEHCLDPRYCPLPTIPALTLCVLTHLSLTASTDALLWCELNL